MDESCSTKELLLEDLKKLRKMVQPPMVVNQLSMLLEDLKKALLCCCTVDDSVQRRLSFPPVGTFTCRKCGCLRSEVCLTMDENTFGILFRNPLIMSLDANPVDHRTLSESSSQEGQDLCDILDDVHLKK